MLDLRRYWRDVREMQRVLPEYVWIVNLEGGDPVEASAAIMESIRTTCCIVGGGPAGVGGFGGATTPANRSGWPDRFGVWR